MPAPAIPPRAINSKVIADAISAAGNDAGMSQAILPFLTQKWSPSHAAAGKYKIGDRVLSANGKTTWLNQVDGNLNNPDSATYDGWINARETASTPDRQAMEGRYRSLALRQCDLRQNSDRALTNNMEFTIPWSQRQAMTDTFHDTQTNNDRITIPVGLPDRLIVRITGWVGFKTAANVSPTGRRRIRIIRSGAEMPGTRRYENAIVPSDLTGGVIQILYVDTGPIEVSAGNWFSLRALAEGATEAVTLDAASTRFLITVEGVRRGSGTFGGVVHDPNIAQRGLAGFDQVVPNNPLRVRVVDDPVLGGKRPVLEFWPRNTDKSVQYPRAQVQSPASLVEGSDYYIGFGIYFPPDYPLYTGKKSPVFHELFGSPFGGYGPTVFRDYDGEIGLWPDPKYDPDTGAPTGVTPIWTMPIINLPGIDLRGKWIDIVRRINLSKSATGWQEISVNTGAGLVQQTLAGNVTRVNQVTMRAGINDGGNQFGSQKAAFTDESIPDVRVYMTEQRIGTSVAAVDPNSYGTW